MTRANRHAYSENSISECNVSSCGIRTSRHTSPSVVVSIVFCCIRPRTKRNTSFAEPIREVVGRTGAISHAVSSAIVSKPTNWALKKTLSQSSIHIEIAGRHEKAIVETPSCVNISCGIGRAERQTSSIAVVGEKIQLLSASRHTSSTQRISVVRRIGWASLHASPSGTISEPAWLTTYCANFLSRSKVISVSSKRTLRDA